MSTSMKSFACAAMATGAFFLRSATTSGHSGCWQAPFVLNRLHARSPSSQKSTRETSDRVRCFTYSGEVAAATSAASNGMSTSMISSAFGSAFGDALPRP